MDSYSIIEKTRPVLTGQIHEPLHEQLLGIAQNVLKYHPN